MHVGAKSRISDVDTDTSNPALYIRNAYDMSRRQAIRRYGVGFCIRYRSLASLGDPPKNWLYRYGLPSDSLKAIEIVQVDRLADAVPFEVVTDADLNKRVIHTDEPEAILRYAFDCTNVGLFDDAFSYALSWKIAENIAMPMTGDENIKLAALRSFDMYINQAASDAAGEVGQEQQREAEWILAR
jgi:hypothetical protein